MSEATQKVALVTGSARGIGLATAKRFLADGWRVVLLDIDGENLKRTFTALNKPDVTLALVCDVADPAGVARALATIAEIFGLLDALVNNAGIAIFKPILDITYDDWSRVLAVNLTGPFLGIRAAAPVMRESGGGAIVNIGSTAGINGHFAAAYSASKWGLRGLTKAAAMEYADWNIRVNAVHPSIVRTPMVAGADKFVEAMEYVTALGRSASLADVAQAVMFLASDEAGYLTGLDLPVDGGFTALGIYRQVWRRATGKV